MGLRVLGRLGVLVICALFLGPGLQAQPAASSSVDPPLPSRFYLETLLQAYDQMTQGQRLQFESQVLPLMHYEFYHITQDPRSNQLRSLSEQRRVFHEMYSDTLGTLMDVHSQRDPSSRRLSRFETRSLQRKADLVFLMQGLSKSPKSTFFLIHDDVYEEHFGGSSSQLSTFHQFVLEPAVNRRIPLQGPSLALGVVGLALVMRAMPDLRGRLIAGGLGALGVLALGSGCGSSQATPHANAPQEDQPSPGQTPPEDGRHQVLRNWLKVETLKQAFQTTTYEEVGAWTDQQTELDLGLRDRKVLFAAHYEFATEFMTRFSSEDAFKRQKMAEFRTYQESHPSPRPPQHPDPVWSVDIQALWFFYLKLLDETYPDLDLVQQLRNATAALKDSWMAILFDTVYQYRALEMTHLDPLINDITELSVRYHLPYTLRELLADGCFLKSLRVWVDDDEVSESPNHAAAYTYRILTDDERGEIDPALQPVGPRKPR
jgi:hypothetical protein